MVAVQTVPDFIAELQDVRLQQDRLFVQSRTSNQSFPANGTAAFDGSAWIVIYPDADSPARLEELQLLGDVDMLADFGAGRITGDIDITTGLLTTFVLSPTPTDEFNYAEERGVIAASGRIELGNRFSEIGDFDEPGVNTRSYWAADYLGNVSTSVGTIRFDGEIDGRFQGNRVNNPTTDLPMKGLVGRTKTDQSRIGGETTHSTRIQIGADNAP